MRKEDKQTEIDRIKELLAYGVMDTPREKEFDDLAQLASIICGTPTALISFIDDRRQWYKAKVGMEEQEVPREEAFCRFTIQQDNLLEIPDTIQDERVRDSSFVKVENGIRFYAGLSLKSDQGYRIGTVCVVDIKPRHLNAEQKTALEILATHAMLLLRTRKKNASLGLELESVLKQKIAETEELLSLKQAAYNSLFMAISKSNGVVEFSPTGIILSVNKVFQKIIGYRENELVGKHHAILIDKNELKKNKVFWSALGSGKFKAGRFKRIRKDGTPVYIQASYSPVMDAGNQILRITKIAQNITTETNYGLELEKAKSMAEDLNIQKDQFIANMSHEIRTPINAITGFTDLLLEKDITPEMRSQLEAIKTAGDNLLFLVNDILDLSKIEAGIFQIEHQPFHLNGIIENVVAMLKLKADQKGLNFDCFISEDVPEYLIGDKNRLAQVLINLLGNAIKFTTQGSVRLMVSLAFHEVKRIWIKFVVSDTGIGIPKNKLASIFDRFTQAEENTSRKFGGTGLGLNIVKLLIKKQSGSIYVESETDRGSSFVFHLPYEIASAMEQVHLIPATTSVDSKIPARILMCEDNPLNQKLVQSILGRTPYRLDLVSNGVEGLKKLTVQKYDLVLMDVQMPEMDGYQTTLAIRNQLKLDIPVIALTAHSMIAERQKCISFGMNDYISKPFKKEELLSKMEYWLKQGSHEKAAGISIQSQPDNTGFSLSYLEELSGGDPEFQKEMLNLFLTQTDEMFQQMEKHRKTGDWSPIAALAHKLKTSFGMIQADITILTDIETHIKSGPDVIEITKSIEALSDQIQRLNLIIHEILTNLEV